MTLVVLALVVADIFWTIGTLAYVEYRLLEERRYVANHVANIDPARMDETHRRIMERIADE